MHRHQLFGAVSYAVVMMEGFDKFLGYGDILYCFFHILVLLPHGYGEMSMEEMSSPRRLQVQKTPQREAMRSADEWSNEQSNIILVGTIVIGT